MVNFVAVCPCKGALGLQMKRGSSANCEVKTGVSYSHHNLVPKSKQTFCSTAWLGLSRWAAVFFDIIKKGAFLQCAWDSNICPLFPAAHFLRAAVKPGARHASLCCLAELVFTVLAFECTMKVVALSARLRSFSSLAAKSNVFMKKSIRFKFVSDHLLIVDLMA